MALDLTGQAVDNLLLSKITAEVGSVKQSMLSEEDFNASNLGEWMLMDGRSCVGTEYESSTLQTVVPDLVTEGLFPRQAKAGRVRGSLEGDAIRNITGSFSAGQYPGYVETTGAFYKGATDSYGYGGANDSYHAEFDASRVVPTSDENRPKNVAFNFFIKVNN